MVNDSSLLEIFTVRYLNKKEIMYRLPPHVKVGEFWPQIINYRKTHGKEVNLLDQKAKKMWCCPIPYMDLLSLIDDHAKQSVDDHVFSIFSKSPQKEKSLIMDALIDEAFNSCVIEGAFSTRKRSAEIITKKIKPTNISEQMIINNYKALEYVLENLHKRLNEDTILEIYKIITENTLSDEDKTERYRKDRVIVWDYNNQREVYEGPNYEDVPKMMIDLIKFINNEDDLHPVEKASIIHFYFVYVHPFFDGNGRTARVISYMFLLQRGYDFFKFFSISAVIREQKTKYYKAIENVEEYQSDLTYFIDFNSKMIINSLFNVLNRIGKEFGKLLIYREMDNRGLYLNARLKKSIAMFIKMEKNYISIEEYQKKYKISYETARKDLNVLEESGIFTKSKAGKKYIYKFIGLEKLGLGEFTAAKEQIFK